MDDIQNHPGTEPATMGFRPNNQLQIWSTLFSDQGCMYSAFGLITQVNSGFEIYLGDHSSLFGPTLCRQCTVTS